METRVEQRIRLIKTLLEIFQADTHEALEKEDFSKVNSFKIVYRDNMVINFDSDLAEDNCAIQCALEDMIDTYKDYLD